MSNKDYINNIDGAERRFFTAPVNFRESHNDEENVIEGVASVVSRQYNMGWYREEVLPGAFDEVINDDVRALFNHDPNYILARSVNGQGTLQLYIDDAGNLAYRYKTPDRQFAKDLQDAIRSGDVTQSSFAFKIKEQRWIEIEGEPELRQIVKLERLYDVSPVTYPASPDTTVAKRSFESVRDTQEHQYKGTPTMKYKHELNRRNLK